MIEYKIISSATIKDAEIEINKLAKIGWVVVTTSISQTLPFEIIITLKRDLVDPFKKK
jgi:hypothetical protein